jgi:hypothetical protein
MRYVVSSTYNRGASEKSGRDGHGSHPDGIRSEEAYSVPPYTHVIPPYDRNWVKVNYCSLCDTAPEARRVPTTTNFQSPTYRPGEKWAILSHSSPLLKPRGILSLGQRHAHQTSREERRPRPILLPVCSVMTVVGRLLYAHLHLVHAPTSVPVAALAPPPYCQTSRALPQLSRRPGHTV